MVRPFRRLLVIAALGLLAGFGAAWTQGPVGFSSTPALGVSPSFSNTLNQVLAGHQPPERFIMVTARRGYLLTTSDSLWGTNNAGQRWTRVSAVPTALNLTVTGGQIWAQTAHLLWSRPLTGAHWTGHPMPTLEVNPAQMDWINGQDGWVITSQGMAAGAESVQIWVTHTAGRQWTPVLPHGLPSQGSKFFAFRTLQDGWMFGTDALRLGMVQFYHSETGGVHWSPVSLTLPARFRHQIVTFTGWHHRGAANGLLVVANPTASASPLVRWTIYHRTASTRWKHGAIETTSPEPTPPTVSWTGSTAWIIHGSQLWRGDDWGRRWQLVHHGGKSIQALSWVIARPSLGYAVIGDHILPTSNDGISWKSTK